MNHLINNLQNAFNEINKANQTYFENMPSNDFQVVSSWLFDNSLPSKSDIISALTHVGGVTNMIKWTPIFTRISTGKSSSDDIINILNDVSKLDFQTLRIQLSKLMCNFITKLFLGIISLVKSVFDNDNAQEITTKIIKFLDVEDRFKSIEMTAPPPSEVAENAKQWLQWLALHQDKLSKAYLDANQIIIGIVDVFDPMSIEDIHQREVVIALKSIFLIILPECNKLLEQSLNCTQHLRHYLNLSQDSLKRSRDTTIRGHRSKRRRK